MKIVNRISLNFGKFRLLMDIKCKNGGVLQIFYKMAIKKMQSNTRHGVRKGKGNIGSQDTNEEEKKQKI